MAEGAQSLADVLATGDRVRLICKACGAHQPVYIQAMIDKHGPDVTFETAVRRRILHAL